MKIPRLDLKRLNCTRYKIEVVSFIGKDDYSKLTEPAVLARFKRDEPCSLLLNYTRNKRRYVLHVVSYATRLKDRQRYALLCRLEYDSGAVNLKNTNKDLLQEEKLLGFLQSLDAEVKGKVMANFLFPADKYEPAMALPYSREDLPVKKKIEICGLDLVVDTGKTKYRELITVSEDAIYVNLALFDIRQPLSESLVKSKLKESNALAFDLVRIKNKGRKTNGS